MPPISSDKTYALFSTESNRELIADLERSGARYILFPRVETYPIKDDNLISTLPDLAGFSWIVFTDIYSVDFFITLQNQHGIDPFILDELRVCAIGESVADRLRAFKLHVDFIADSFDNNQTVGYPPDENDGENLKVLVLLEQNAVLKGPTQTTVNKINITEFRVYSSHCDGAHLAKVKSLLKGGAVDEFILTSPFDVTDIAHIFQTDDLTDLLAGITLTANNEATSQALKDFRLA